MTDSDLHLGAAGTQAHVADAGLHAHQIVIVPYRDSEHRAQVEALWRQAFGYATAHNRPGLAIDRKLAVDDGLFFMAMAADRVVGTVMAGYDGHRGWLYAVSVQPEWRGRGVGSALVRHAEHALSALGCLKINLQLADGNDAVAAFYEALGYAVERRVSMGKCLPENVPA